MNVSAYVNRLQNEPDLDIKLAHEDKDFILDLHKEIQQIFPVIAQMQLDDAIRWLIGWNRYVKDKKGKIFRFRTFQYDRGDILHVELFGHMGHELTYPHPAMVLYNGFNWVLVAPISSSAYQDGDPFHVDLTTKDADIHHDCAILMNKVQALDKQRIIKKFGKVRNRKILDAVDGIMIENYTPVLFKKFQSVIAEAERAEMLEQELDALRQENEELKRQVIRYQELEAENALSKNA